MNIQLLGWYKRQCTQRVIKNEKYNSVYRGLSLKKNKKQIQ